jgi:hypothetical protein
VVTTSVVFAAPVLSRDSNPNPGHIPTDFRVTVPADRRLDAGPLIGPIYRVPVQDTTWLAAYTFDNGASCNAEGWTTVDVTAQTGDYWRVDDFAGLAGMDPIEGSQSMWCGARPSDTDPVLCRYASLPGYGNSWDQVLCSRTCLSVTGDVEISFSTRYDTEAGYDAMTLEIDRCDDAWVPVYGGVDVWDGVGSGTLVVPVADSLHGGSLRFRFHFESDGAISDEECGDFSGIWIDELSVTDAGGTVVPYEDFEDESVGDQEADDWVTCTPPGYGDFAGLFPGISVLQEDFCRFNNTCLWGFFKGSTYDYGCGGWPAQKTVPYEDESGRYIENQIRSPYIEVAGTGSTLEIRFDAYHDGVLTALIFYTWHVRSIIDGCPTEWRKSDFGFYHQGSKEWRTRVFPIGQFLVPGAKYIQASLGVLDMCPLWGGMPGDCECHSHGPLFDNVSVYRIAADGPQWWVRDLDLFQDNFSEDGTITGTARADAALDIRSSTDPLITPGDSVNVTVDDPDNGLDYHVPGDPSSGPAVYCYISVDGPNAATPSAALVDDPRYPVIGTLPIAGRTWTQIQMDTTSAGSGFPVEDRFNVDLNDNLFVPGDTVWFFFGARSGPPSNQWTYFAMSVPTRSGQTDDIGEAATYPDEFTILPAGGYNRGGDILYVDGMNFRGAQPYFDTAFDMFGIRDVIDRYDIRAPSSSVGNHPASRVTDIGQQILPAYRKIIWNTGDLGTAFSDGSGEPDKSDDTGLLLAFLGGLTEAGGVYLSGDDVSYEWDNTFTSGSSADLRSTYIQFGVEDGDHRPELGLAPYGIGVPSGVFSDGFGLPDTLFVFGGCPGINDFDLLTAEGDATVEMFYVDHSHGSVVKGAVVADVTTNPIGADVGFLLSGFSFHEIRDESPAGIVARAVHLERIVRWLHNILPYPTGTGTPGTAVNDLGQNYPNPFNPTTTIRYQVRETGPVTLRIYNVAGQLVRTLVDGEVRAGVVHQARWEGRNDSGQPVSSGVYFYKLTAKGFTQTRKMVILK